MSLQDSPHLINAIRTLMRPIIKLMLRNGVDMGSFTTEIRRLYVDVAQDHEFAVENKKGKRRKTSASRIAMITGINRKEVKRLIEDRGKDERYGSYAYSNRAVRVINGWSKDKKFCDENDSPAALSYGSSSGESSFEELVKIYSGDVSARVVLDELIRVGSVSQASNGTVTLEGKGYVPSKCNKEMLAIGATAIADLARTVEHNVSRPEDVKSFFQKSVEYVELAPDIAGYYRKFLKEDANSFLDKQIRTIENLDEEGQLINTTEESLRIGVGLYYFEDVIDD